MAFKKFFLKVKCHRERPEKCKKVSRIIWTTSFIKLIVIVNYVCRKQEMFRSRYRSCKSNFFFKPFCADFFSTLLCEANVKSCAIFVSPISCNKSPDKTTTTARTTTLTGQQQQLASGFFGYLNWVNRFAKRPPKTSSTS